MAIKRGSPTSNDSEMQLPSASNDSETTYSTFNVHTDTSTAAYKADQEESAKRGGIALTDLKYERIIGTNVLKRVNIDASFRDEKVHPLLREGVEYARGISAMLGSNATSEKIVYNLDGKYAFFNTYYDIDDYTKDSPETPKIKFYVDGQLIATGGKYVGSDQFIFFDVKGVKKLEISFEVSSPKYSTVVALYKPRLYVSKY
ncbi:NPCBM/NEW2 domain-containing protein [Paenibacillus alginolyticus]|uniref:NPCBM/NEW2 domain-containing protein n=1 Tax=Paenibacillus alginolyticus TaxID=59839 RepID=A0ABT4GP69_9BACL|nr:NPCBM/NEW2 domain-containing protein [Paenibacillus alginolyticus]MCY9697803.1 NPCBM/NEW2 domain-containing protein [Paenibacillus alginolyticus]MEC0143720.1 NPCBM/NEW2 domain-containing protein [Paenibacillus alginolyticus]